MLFVSCKRLIIEIKKNNDEFRTTTLHKQQNLTDRIDTGKGMIHVSRHKDEHQHADWVHFEVLNYVLSFECARSFFTSTFYRSLIDPGARATSIIKTIICFLSKKRMEIASGLFFGGDAKPEINESLLLIIFKQE